MEGTRPPDSESPAREMPKPTETQDEAAVDETQDDAWGRVPGAAQAELAEAMAPERSEAGEQLTPENREKLDNYLDRYVPGADERGRINETVAAAESDPQISGLNDWVDFSTQTNNAKDPKLVRDNLNNDVNELKVALSVAEQDPDARVQVGGDAHADLRPGTIQRMSSFDVGVDSSDRHTNVEVTTNKENRLDVADLGDAINHAAEKVNDGTTGRVEAALVTTWPQEPYSVKGGRTIDVDADGNATMIMKGGREVGQGNIFDDYAATLNSGKSVPDGAAQVDALSVYSRDGELVKRLSKDPDGVWQVEP